MITIVQKLHQIILKFILDNTLENARTAKSIYFCSVSLNRDMDIGKILFALSYVKHKQFDFSLQANRISIKKTISCKIKRMISEL